MTPSGIRDKGRRQSIHVYSRRRGKKKKRERKKRENSTDFLIVGFVLTLGMAAVAAVAGHFDDFVPIKRIFKKRPVLAFRPSSFQHQLLY
ncbi:hypothetical protein OUZ56_028625 [Daphnia magna]|uniref:Uncharacterized protein n=1 Tax=Daphnia magna TaxID=35525 RepID=A0ABR0B4I4_9CRUS|nr:hypothetical protein OUZ56_028625 [Daphnia magna]